MMDVELCVEDKVYSMEKKPERRASFRPQPKETVPYTVQSGDTLEGIAARYNVTPSELTILNKLHMRTVFPGQIIYIPEKNSLQVLEQLLKESAEAINAASSEQDSPKPGHVERIPGVPPGEENSSILPVLKVSLVDGSGSKESLRINSKYVTDGEGVVCGVLIVTTNHIMFDPNVSDPLVIEYGMDKYGVEAPMGWIVKAALYTDIFRMRKDSSGKSVNVYHSKVCGMKKSKSHDDNLRKISNDKNSRRLSSVEVGNKRHESLLPFSNSFQENLSKICEQADDAENEDNETSSSVPLSSAVTDSILNTDENKNRTVKKPLSSASSFDSDEAPSRKASISDEDGGVVTIDFGSPKKKSHFEKTKQKLHKGLKRLSISDNLFPSSSNGRRMSMPVFSALTDFKLKSPTAKSSIAAEKPSKEDKGSSGPTYVNMVEEKPELFAPLDNLELIPRPAKSFCNTPLYLCLRMGEPLDQTTPKINPVVHFGQEMKPEYWFSIPKDCVDSLYHFFLRWFPEKYGEIDNINYEELGYLPIESEEKELSEEKSSIEQRRASWAFPWRRKSRDVTEITTVTPSTPEGWELLDYTIGSTDTSIHVPELLTPSTILSEEQTLEIAKHLPARAMNSWSLIYSTTAHGFSLKTMYRKMMEFDSPVLIVIANRNNDIFGALLSSPLRMSDHFYGTGESFLFTLAPELKFFHWAGENNYFIKGNTDSFIVGSSEGQFGLWLDDDLFRGRTNACQTFANDPLCAEQDFVVKSLEAWGFV